MKAKISRFLVVALGVSILGSFAIVQHPRTTYGQSDPSTTGPTTDLNTLEQSQQTTPGTLERIRAQKEYNDGYNRGFERGREEERQRLDEEAFNSQQGGCCPSGGGQQQRRR